MVASVMPNIRTYNFDELLQKYKISYIPKPVEPKPTYKHLPNLFADDPIKYQKIYCWCLQTQPVGFQKILPDWTKLLVSIEKDIGIQMLNQSQT